jgi:predicted dehydrogenase
VYAQTPGVVLVGVVDSDPRRAEEIGKRHKCPWATDHHAFIQEIDLVSIAVPTHFHHAVAKDFLEHGVHVLLEKPMTRTLEEADELNRIAEARRVVIQIGHIERFNQAVVEVEKILEAPRFIEAMRLGSYSKRNTDIGVVMDLMIHDLDIIFDLVDSPVERLEATGVSVLSGKDDIANVRITFTNGCIANVTASRVSMEAKRKIRFFCPKHYISLDYQKQELMIYRLKKERDPNEQNLLKLVDVEHRTFGRQEPLAVEIQSFIGAVRGMHPPEVSGVIGRRALAAALEITRQIQDRNLQIA